ncbi:unnamed protein product [Rotaria magnacalcarata]|uniref:Uncharacterized protein n=2 Tax=Rotaria magnacalcarata TaxID=392030 RepID=A0A815VA82_9BILA|nr:unnamed protein product [Rotaria magnacalcarata]CAF1653126.1 unnamed protein product [Rotaria magnacalcarata]CAF2095485.1 unnamed protein product [Rotaria magnacalcarata]CAF5053125.1 unnamed protein product [Rotaria magnacalcarata]CAF5162126.1 unnamed protein product [Rotaria magnacalcarata]
MSKAHEVTAWIDLNIIDKSWGKSLTKEFDDKKAKYLIESMPVPNTITWSISNIANNIDEEFVSQLLLLMTHEQFFQFVSVCNANKNNISDLIQTINDKYKAKKSITIVIIGASSSLNLSKLLTRSSSIKSHDLDNIYLELQLQFNCIIKFAEKDNDLALLILSFTKAVTVAPEKRLKNSSPFSFHVDAMKQYKPIRVDIDQTNKTLDQLWKQILQQFPHMGVEQAQAIVNQYGTVQALVQAYKRCQTENDAKLLLADIQVRRGAGVLTTTRKIGPQMSEKIWKLFTSIDGNDLI